MLSYKFYGGPHKGGFGIVNYKPRCTYVHLCQNGTLLTQLKVHLRLWTRESEGRINQVNTMLSLFMVNLVSAKYLINIIFTPGYNIKCIYFAQENSQKLAFSYTTSLKCTDDMVVQPAGKSENDCQQKISLDTSCEISNKLDNKIKRPKSFTWIFFEVKEVKIL